MKKRIPFFTLILGVGIWAFFGMGIPASEGAPKKLVRISSGSAGGVYQILGSGMAKVISEHAPDLDVTAITPPNINQVPMLMQSGQTVAGIGMADMMDRATKGTGEFQGKKFDKVVPLLGMYDNGMAYVSLKNSSINQFKEIQGKRMAVPSAATKSQVEAVVRAAGLDLTKVNWRFMSYQEGAEALSDGNVDIGTFTSFPKSGLIDQMMSTKGIRFLEIDENTRKTFDRDNPLWKMLETPANTYTGQTKPALGPAFYTILYGSADADPEMIYQIVKAILDNHSDVAALHPAGKYITLETTKRYIEARVIDPEKIHPGAARYFKEKGIIK
jgi:TRAP transporter TAXI family solute receptor